MEPGDIRAETNEVESAFLWVSADISAGSCVVELPAGCNVRFESIGRDDEGGYLRAEDGTVMRLNADLDTELLDELLSKEEIVIQELDTFGEFLPEYPVRAVPYENRVGFGA